MTLMRQTKPAKRQIPRPEIALPGRAALQTRQAAAYISLSVRTLKRLVRRGVFHPNKRTGRCLFAVHELDEFVKGRVL
jgi:hypothetical protein